MSVLQPDWDDKEIEIVDKNDFLNGLEFERVSDIQKMLYIEYKKIEQIEARLLLLEKTLLREVK